MTDRAFRILNVFALDGDRLSGNPLCVFEDARGLDDDAMQALARQLNLSETTFVLPPDDASATARVRIFTPAHEMPFAGHPTLGTAHVVRALTGARERVVLEMKAGLVEATADGDTWTLRTARGPETTPPTASPADLAEMLGLPAAAVAGTPLFVDTGAEQLVVPLASVEHVHAARPDAALLATRGLSAKRRVSMAYAWARASSREVVARFFFLSHGAVIEDPATGSACANLGGWHVATGAALPLELVVRQGDAVRRPSRLVLRVDADRRIFVSGLVVELGRGTFSL